MNREQYDNTLRNAHVIRMMAANLDSHGDLDAALAAIERADSVGPILHPTSYRTNADRMHEDRDTLRAVRDLARLGQEVSS